MNQEPFTGAQTAAHEDVGPDGKEGFGQAGGLIKGHAFRHGQTMGGGGRHIVGVAATGQQGADRVAHRPVANALADRGDFTRPFQPRQIAGGGRRCIKPGTLQRIRAVDARIGQPDHNLAHVRFGHGPLRQLQHVRPAGFGDFHSVHRLAHCLTPQVGPFQRPGMPVCCPGCGALILPRNANGPAISPLISLFSRICALNFSICITSSIRRSRKAQLS